LLDSLLQEVTQAHKLQKDIAELVVM